MADEDTQYKELDLDNLEVPEEDDKDEGQRTLQSGTKGVDRITQDTEVIVEDDDEEEPKVKQARDENDDDEEEDEQRKKPRKSRAQTRIRNLANEKKKLEAELERERRQRFELENRMQEQSYSSARSQKAALEKRLNDLAYQQERALQDGNYRAHAQLSQQVADTNLQMRVLEHETRTPPQRRQYLPQQRTPEIPDAAQDWAEDNGWFMNPKSQDDAIKRQAALVLSSSMINEGKDPSDPGFYQELDTQLAERFRAKAENERDDEDRREYRNQNDRPVIAGSGRQAPVRRSGKNTVRITREEKDMADRLGITPQQYVKQKQAIDENGGGWNEIL